MESTQAKFEGWVPITEYWLKEVGFKWHQLERQDSKQWLLWLAGVFAEGFTSFEDLGIELSAGRYGEWFCWLRADTAHRYSRFIHIRHIRYQHELITMVEGITGQAWNPANNINGSMTTPARAERIRAQRDRLDQRIVRDNPWRDIEKDETRGRSLPEHMQIAVDGGKAK